MDAIADVEHREGPRGEGGIKKPCRDEVRDDGGTEGDDDTVSEANQSLGIEQQVGHESPEKARSGGRYRPQTDSANG